MLIFLVVVCVLFGVGVFAFLTISMRRSDPDYRPSSGPPTGSGFTGNLGYRPSASEFSFANPPRIRELSPGCLLAVIVVGSIWFIMWGIVLLLALRLLNTPLD